MASFSIEFTKMNYLAQQPGGLTDQQFDINPDTSLELEIGLKLIGTWQQ